MTPRCGWRRAARAVAAGALLTALSALPASAGEVIVQFRADAPTARKAALAAATPTTALRAVLDSRAAALGARAKRALRAGAAVGERTQVVAADGVDAAVLARELAADPEVEWAVPNGRKRIVAAPNDPLYASGPPVDVASQTGGPVSGQWYLRAPTAAVRSAIDIEPAWDRTRGSPAVVVAVLDTGVRFEHPDLGRAADGGALLPGYDFVADPVVANDGNGRDADPSDPGDWVSAADRSDPKFSSCDVASSSWHGTATASLVAARADNGIGMAGAAPGVRVLPLRVLGKCYGNDADILAAIRWAAGLTVPGVPANPTPARIVNLSLGSIDACSAAYQSAFDAVAAVGVTVVAAAGNTAGGPVGSPASCDGVVAVVALRHAGSKVGFSDLGPQIDIAAPGGNCVNTAAGTPCLYPIVVAEDSGAQGPVAPSWSDAFDPTVGTSFAAPLVAGVAALMVSQQPALTPAQLTAALRATARPFPTTGADNGPDDATPVEACRAPQSGVTQLQCYCTTALCGAGMLDAGAAVAAVSGPMARIDVVTPAPAAAAPVVLSAAASSPSGGASIVGYTWVLVDGGGIVAAFDTPTNDASATLTPTAPGRFTVQLTVVDSVGTGHTVTTSVDVAAAPVVVTPPTGGSGGGGSAAPGWTLGLLALTAVLRRLRR